MAGKKFFFILGNFSSTSDPEKGNIGIREVGHRLHQLEGIAKHLHPNTERQPTYMYMGCICVFWVT